MILDQLSKKYYANKNFMKSLQNTKHLAEVAEQLFDVVYLTGGHGTIYDFLNDTTLQNIIREHYENKQNNFGYLPRRKAD